MRGLVFGMVDPALPLHRIEDGQDLIAHTIIPSPVSRRAEIQSIQELVEV